MATGNFWRLHVIGSQGWAEMRGEHCLAVSALEGEPEIINFEPVDIEKAELEAFADAVAGGTPYPVSHDEAVHSIVALLAIEESAEKHAEVSIAG